MLVQKFLQNLIVLSGHRSIKRVPLQAAVSHNFPYFVVPTTFCSDFQIENLCCNLRKNISNEFSDW